MDETAKADHPLARAAEVLGGQAAVGAVVGATQQYVSDLIRGVRRKGITPAEWCIPIEEATRAAGECVPRWVTRPDLFQAEAA